MFSLSVLKRGIQAHRRHHPIRRHLGRNLLSSSTPQSLRLGGSVESIQRYTTLVSIARSSLSIFASSFSPTRSFDCESKDQPTCSQYNDIFAEKTIEGYATRTLGAASASAPPFMTRNSILNLNCRAAFQTWGDSHVPFLTIAGGHSARGFSSLIDGRLLNRQRTLQLQNIHCTHEQKVLMSTSSSSSENPKGSFSTQAKIPTPKAANPTTSSPLASFHPKAVFRGVVDFTWSMTKMVVKFILSLPGNILFFLTHPKERREKITEIKDFAKKEFDHYYIGTKLLMADVRTARSLMGKTLSGATLTRRERKQLLRTVSDLFRLVPFSMFILIPFMEFALPFALRLFPNMLPSTFQDSLKSEESMKRELQSRIAMAQFFQETMEGLAKEQKRIAANRMHGQNESNDSIASKQEASAADMLKFLDRARKGEMMPPEVIIQYANYFQDDLTLDNMPRMQLINMCKYMSIPPYGSDSFLRFQLRHRIRQLKEDDQRILWEGIDSLTKMELREACQERGMRSTGLSKESYKRSLQQWLDLSVNKNVPISLLIMSRTFFLQEETISPAPASGETQSMAGLADAISGMDKEVLNEVILQVATSEERKSDLDVRKIQLEVLTQQNQRIKAEQAERQAASHKKEAAEKIDIQSIVPVAEVARGKDQEPAATPTTIGSTTQKEHSAAVVEKDDEVKGKVVEKAAEVELGERELSPEEMDSISQLLSADPVLKERGDLARIKQAMKEKIEGTKPAIENPKPENLTGTGVDAVIATEETNDELRASSIINGMVEKAAKEADQSTSFSSKSNLTTPNDQVVFADSDGARRQNESQVATSEEGPEDPVVAKLKKRIESMVDKIENQLSDVQIKIGDKFHLLDKDKDGILSREEMAEVLSQVLKNISFEEALEIADAMDEDKDGVFTAQELIKWIETNKLVKFESEGRDAEMDKIMESHAAGKEEASEDPPRQK